jgi:hypothetical protein
MAVIDWVLPLVNHIMNVGEYRLQDENGNTLSQDASKGTPL